MCEAGRVLHHLRNSIGDPRNAVLLVGFQAQHTLGRRLEEGRAVVRIFGEEMERKAEVIVMRGFSGHADREELFQFAAGLKQEKPRRVFLVHGEPEQQDPFAERLRRQGGAAKVDAPALGQTFDL
jgi:metallo-beta-lactamase family protein